MKLETDIAIKDERNEERLQHSLMILRERKWKYQEQKRIWMIPTILTGAGAAGCTVLLFLALIDIRITLEKANLCHVCLTMVIILSFLIFYKVESMWDEILSRIKTLLSRAEEISHYSKRICDISKAKLFLEIEMKENTLYLTYSSKGGTVMKKGFPCTVIQNTLISTPEIKVRNFGIYLFLPYGHDAESRISH